ncbi:hypothetical protein JSO53_04220 [Riemerella anatipestifer]|uniref:DUF6808 domain-containing protein n=1 Tax=Riemerella anatipestifer TaxID=34085 RepID=UPI0002AB4C4E|nr:hypothetical protein [Riemerella anatipestifer]AGC39517.1 hypothetical protein G148_0212 [Riemerella anatipestifer RA-CH-2]AKP71646.1 hypothetical protein CG09_1485 [Riemerella anatipestifer]MBT0561955.1 hypothetical protein [Riemerella anatipestifer]MCU7539538.1 hypothetical protein [Riemerella anatipestifer]MCU7571532.1 hypothetical protein [Riemerella anatipestifer]
MKSKIFIIILSLLLGFSVFLHIQRERAIGKQEQQISELIEHSYKNEIINHYYRDSIKHTVFKEKVVETTNEKQLAIGKTYADSLEQALKMSIKKIDQVSKINAELVARLQLREFTQPNGDKILSHNDKYLNLNYYPQTDSVDFRYNIRLNEARYKDKKWLFGKTNHYIDIWSDDPRVQINGLKSYRIRGQPLPRWGLGVHAGYGISLNNGILQTTPVIGLGINYNLINF